MTNSSSMNVGTMDRIVRSIAGVYMIMNGLKHKESAVHQMGIAAGGALLASSLTGHCAMLSAFGASSVPGKENNVLNRLNTVLPVQGLKNILKSDATSENGTQSSSTDESKEENLSLN